LRLTPGSIQANSRTLRSELPSLVATGPSVTSDCLRVTRRSFALGLASALLNSRLSAQQKVRRIVSTAPSITEALFALGLGDEVVGVSQYCDFPPAAATLPKVGTYIKPDAEAIARLVPDLVILQRTPSDLTDRLNALHISFIEVPHGTLDDVLAGIQAISQAAGVPNRGKELISRIKNSLEVIQAKAKSMPSPRLIAVVDRKQGTLTDLTAVGPGNYIDQILEIAGGTNVLATPGLPHYPHISLETVIRENPDFILDLSNTQASESERQAARAGVLALWEQNSELIAVRNGHVYFGTSNALLVPGPRAPEAAQTLFDFMHSKTSVGGTS
jgi:iron complex transport system substrate-binding protein